MSIIDSDAEGDLRDFFRRIRDTKTRQDEAPPAPFQPVIRTEQELKPEGMRLGGGGGGGAGREGPGGAPGPQGDKGDTGDITGAEEYTIGICVEGVITDLIVYGPPGQ